MLEVLRSGRLSLGPDAGALRARLRRAGSASPTRSRSPSGTAALHLGVRALGWGEGDEVVTSPFSFVASANCLLYEGATPVFCDVDPVTLNLDPARGLRTRSASAPRACCRSTSSATRRRCRSSSGSPPRAGLGLLEDACEALGAVDAEGREVGSRGNLAAFAFYANKQLTTGEGGMLVRRRPRDRGARCAASATRAARRTWTGSTTTGSASTTGSPSVQAALGVAQLERLDELLAARAARRRALHASGSRRSTTARRPGEGDPDGLVLPCADRGERAPQLVRLRGPAAGRRPTATPSSPTSPSAGSRRRPTCRAST